MKFFIGALIAYLGGTASVFSQSKLVGFQLSPGVTITRVIDHDGNSSGGLDHNGFLRNPADGYTSKVSNEKAVTAGFNYEVSATDKVFLSTGLWFTSKQLLIRNVDGGYHGISRYDVTYLQIPLALKLYLADLNPSFRLYLKAGLSFDIKVKENLKGPDGAHFWNLAKNMYWNDNTRGRNGDNKPKALFSPVNIGLLGAFGMEYALSDDWILFTSLSYNAGLFDMINPSLRHNDINRTKVTDHLTIKTHVFTVDVGILLAID